MNGPPTWVLVLLVLALVLVALAVQDFRAEWQRRMVDRSINSAGPDGRFRVMTWSEVNAERARTGDVPLDAYTWSTWLHDKREDAGLVLAVFSGEFGR